MYEGKSAAEEIKILLNDSRKKAREKAKKAREKEKENENKIKLKNFDKLLKDFQDLDDIFKKFTCQNLTKENLEKVIINLINENKKLKNEIEKSKLKNTNNSGYENNNNYSRY